MLSAVEEIRKTGLAEFIAKYHINAKTHQNYSNLVLLKYDQLESPRKVKAVDDCRGLILDTANNYQPVCWSYARFYNLGEDVNLDFDWSSAKVFEKADGSLVQLYHYDNAWHVATSGTPDASGPINHLNKTFKELFWDTWNTLGYELPTDTDMCYFFELMTPDNVVIVQHTTPSIVLHGMRNRVTGKESLPRSMFNWKIIKCYPLTTVDEIVKSLDNVSPTVQEGYVCVDANFNRMKVKSPQYVALHHLKEGLTDKRLLDIIRNNESEEFLAYFPKYKDLYTEIKEKYTKLVNAINEAFDQAKDQKDQKSFALQVKSFKYSSILFLLRSGKISSVKQGLQEMNLDRLFECLN